jgi:hypothetical protein
MLKEDLGRTVFTESFILHSAAMFKKVPYHRNTAICERALPAMNLILALYTIGSRL